MRIRYWSSAGCSSVLLVGVDGGEDEDEEHGEARAHRPAEEREEEPPGHEAEHDRGAEAPLEHGEPVVGDQQRVVEAVLLEERVLVLGELGLGPEREERPAAELRSEERRVGKEGVSTGGSWGGP